MNVIEQFFGHIPKQCAFCKIEHSTDACPDNAGVFRVGLRLHRDHGVLTRKRDRKHHTWIVVVKRELYWEHDNFGEDYHAATALGMKLARKGIIANLILRLS